TTNVNDYATFTSLACDDDNGVTIGTKSTMYYTGLTAGNIYYIQVDGKDNSTPMGTFCLSVDEMVFSMLASSTACAPGQRLAAVNESYAGWLSITDATGKLIALIKNNSGTGISSYRSE